MDLDRNKALELLRTHIHSDQLIGHSLATEAIMAGLASRFGEDSQYWGLIGLLHDIDFELTHDNPRRHTLEAARILEQAGFDAQFIAIIQSHNCEDIGGKRSTRIEFALTAAESITGLIVATALVYPDKKLSSVKASSVKKRMKEKAFARSVSRERIMECELMGIDLPLFIDISLAAMNKISDDLGL